MKSANQQLLIIQLIVFIGFIGTSMAYPIFPPLFLHPAYGTIVPSAWHESARSIFLGVALAAYPLGMFIGSPILGGCSDSYGRRRILMVSLAGSTIGYLLSAISLHFNWLWLLLLSRFCTGIMEGNLAIVRAMAMELGGINKYKSLGSINSVSAIGYVVGPILGGFLSDKHIVPWFSFAFPFMLAALFSAVAAMLAGLKLIDKKSTIPPSNIVIWERFNIIKRFRVLFKNNVGLKYILIISTIFTFSVDIFYEFGPVYLTKLWLMTPAKIAIYNGILCFTLAIGSGWFSHYLSRYFSVRQVLVVMMLLVAIIFGLLVVYPSPTMAFILFGLAGLTIATANTNFTVQVSNVSDKFIQGEAMGAQLSLRTLGDALICLIGGFLIISSVMLPLILSFFLALLAWGIFLRRTQRGQARPFI